MILISLKKMDWKTHAKNMKIIQEIVYYLILTSSINRGSILKKYFYLALLTFSIFSFSADFDFSDYTNFLDKEIKETFLVLLP